MKLQELIRDGYLFLDGAMGTELQAAGLKLGERPELLCFTAPETVAAIHRRYIAAGSQVIYANTFQANGHKLEGTGYTPGPGGHPALEVARTPPPGQTPCGLRLRPHRHPAGAPGHPALR